MSEWRIENGDVATVLRDYKDHAFDAVLCDPPYGLSFMGNRWDYDVPSVDSWREVFRVLKPGAPLLSFFGTRTYHRGVVRIEDAGFDIEDTISWFYGTGKPSTKYRLKPAHEPVVLARRPHEGTIEMNLRRWGVGALAIEACRVPANGQKQMAGADPSSHARGRWPANVILDEEAGKTLDAQSGHLVGRGNATPKVRDRTGYSGGHRPSLDDFQYGDSGGASRFFYCAKAGKTEREGNRHPTVKPLALTTYLARLVLPECPGAILIPYAGSGSEMIGAVAAGWAAVVGIEREAEYITIAERKLSNASAA